MIAKDLLPSWLMAFWIGGIFGFLISIAYTPFIKKDKGCYIEYWTEQDSLYISEPNVPLESVKLLTEMLNAGMGSDYIFINCELTKQQKQ